VDSILTLRTVILRTLHRVYETYIEQGEEGKKLLPTINQFGDRPTRFDVIAEEVVIAALREWHQPQVGGIRIFSEEHGTFVIGDENDIKHSVWLDGCDGSKVYVESQPDTSNAGFGTVIAVAAGENPTYDDVLFSAILRLSTAEVMFRVEKGNTIIVDILTGDQRLASARQINRLDDNCVVLSDNGFPQVHATFDVPLNRAGIRTHYTGTTCGNAFRVIAREYVPIGSKEFLGAALVEMLDKGCIEMPALHHLVVGADGDMYDLATGRRIARRHIREYGQDANNPQFFVLVSNPQIATQVFAPLTA